MGGKCYLKKMFSRNCVMGRQKMLAFLCRRLNKTVQWTDAFFSPQSTKLQYACDYQILLLPFTPPPEWIARNMPSSLTLGEIRFRINFSYSNRKRIGSACVCALILSMTAPRRIARSSRIIELRNIVFLKGGNR